MNSRFLKDTAAKVMNLGHRAILKASGNRLLATPFGMPVVICELTG